MIPPIDVPLMDPERTAGAWRAEAERRLCSILKTQQYVAGPYVDALETALRERLGVEAIAVDSGTDALWLVLRAWFDMLPAMQREVIVPAFSFVATAGAVVAAGGVPVFADVDPDTYLLDSNSVKARVSERTAAIVPVHLFGAPVDPEPLRALAPHAFILEDAAQAIDATLRGTPAGALGDAATFSFYPSKNLAAAGDGGLVATRHPQTAERVRALRAHGQTARGQPHRWIGTNSRMDEFQAAVLGAKLPHLAAWTRARQAIATRYDEALAQLPLHRPRVSTETTSAWHLYTVRLSTPAARQALQDALTAAGIGSGVYYARPLHREPCFEAFAPAPCPTAQRLSETVLSLPCFPGLGEAEQDRVIAVTKRALGAGASV